MRFLALCVLCVPLLGQAQTAFSTERLHQFPDFPVESALADLNGDGALDLVFPSLNNHTICWYANDGNGVFLDYQEVSNSAFESSQIACADLDGDGDQDVVGSASQPGEIAWYENLGSEWTEHPLLTGNMQPEDIVIADFNQDGLPDVCAASETDKLACFFNAGGGTFNPPVLLPSTQLNLRTLEAGDVNGDGYPDLLVGAYNSLTYWTGTAAEEFGQEVYLEDGLNLIQDLVIADFDADGDQDILLANGILSTYKNIDWYENIGGGELADAQTLIELTVVPRSMVVSDVNGDTFPDILLGSHSALLGGEQCRWLLNNGNQTLTSSTPLVNFDSMATVYHALHVAYADLNGDGISDVLTNLGVHAWIVGNLGNGDGTFESAHTLVNCVYEARDAHPVDLDNDGDLDVLAAGYGNDRIVWFENSGDGFFNEGRMVSESFLSPEVLESADIDGDGWQDVLAIGKNPHETVWFRNLGDGTFSEKIVVSDEGQSRVCLPADFDNDGDVDLYVGHSGLNEVIHNTWFRNLGNGVFEGPIVLGFSDFSSGPYYAHVADLDTDGDLDVVSTYYSDNRVVWYRNEGGGEFSDELTITNVLDTTSELSFVHAVCSGDFDGDGAISVIAACSTGCIWEFPMQADGSFGPSILVADSLTQINSLTAVDLDNDGDLDIGGCTPNHDVLFWLENVENGANFQWRLISEDLDSVYSSKFADLDGDGDVDILSAAIHDDQVYLHRNLFSLGCTDAEACNYNASATADNGSCFYSEAFDVVDVNNDGVVGTTDILAVVADLGCAGLSCTGDLNNDGVTNSDDLFLLFALFGTECP